MGPTLVTYLVSRKEDVDFSCFKSVTITGSKIFPELLAKFKVRLTRIIVLNMRCFINFVEVL